MLVVNFFGGPGVGKSTNAARLFARLKERGVSVELVTEYAKQLTWDERYNTLSDQIYVFAKQQRALERLRNKVEVVVTDAPLLNSIVYKDGDLADSKAFDDLIVARHNTNSNLNIVLSRDVPYVTQGRNQTLEEAKDVDRKVRRVLSTNSVEFRVMNPITFSVECEALCSDIQRRLALKTIDYKF